MSDYIAVAPEYRNDPSAERAFYEPDMMLTLLPDDDHAPTGTRSAILADDQEFHQMQADQFLKDHQAASDQYLKDQVQKQVYAFPPPIFGERGDLSPEVAAFHERNQVLNRILDGMIQAGRDNDPTRRRLLCDNGHAAVLQSPARRAGRYQAPGGRL